MPEYPESSSWPRVSNPAPDSGEAKNDVIFGNLVFSGKLQSSICYLLSEASSGVLDMPTVVSEGGETVRDILMQKHPLPAEPPELVLLDKEPDLVNAIFYDKITVG